MGSILAALAGFLLLRLVPRRVPAPKTAEA
jgi:hypothetical protein